MLARGRDRLAAAADEVTAAGGVASAIPTDVADSSALEAAAHSIEAELGPIDVWVNNAMTSVFAPFVDIDAAEFERVTAVNYLGFVYGTMTALQHMLPRDRGTIVQVGSALAYRSIPLQSAYCGSKHAIHGFTESLRCELLHDRSRVQVTMVQMPAMNTPQFSWVRSKVPRHPQPVAPVYQPEVGAVRSSSPPIILTGTTTTSACPRHSRSSGTKWHRDSSIGTSPPPTTACSRCRCRAPRPTSPGTSSNPYPVSSVRTGSSTTGPSRGGRVLGDHAPGMARGRAGTVAGAMLLRRARR